ncbi:MAG: 2-hydroxyglutaryl-CoA dehydratase, partial [Chloroflexota bacterium]|nr:2-hydroxyglutaryl-CoA dehydratase [Chloroflexota bacterium]
KVMFGDTQVTEIGCHAKGAAHIFPNTRTVVDIGGQDAKAIRVGEGGEVADFSMNDKCAAGTGRFLANSAEALGLQLGEIGELSLKARHPVKLSTVCTVFVESDILSYLAQGKRVEDILGGVHASIATRTVALMRRVGVTEEVTFTGGVSRNLGIVKALEDKLGCRLNVSPDAHYMGALGAALFAMERAQSGVDRAA